MMTYLSQYPNAKLKQGAPIRSKTNPSRYVYLIGFTHIFKRNIVLLYMVDTLLSTAFAFMVLALNPLDRVSQRKRILPSKRFLRAKEK